jgi:C_GCAxxG_C_C family probable redox protein
VSDFTAKSKEIYLKGYSCSEAIIRGAYEAGLINQDVDIELINKIASAFSGGIGHSGCICGALSGAEMVLGLLKGRKDITENPATIKLMALTVMEKFKNKHKATCCRVLSSGYEFNSVERKFNCSRIVVQTAQILEKVLKQENSKPA